MVRMTTEEFEKICNIIANEDWDGWEFGLIEKIQYCCLIAIYEGKQIHICIDMYGNEISRKAVFPEDDNYWCGWVDEI
jgi:hypothetical protein